MLGFVFIEPQDLIKEILKFLFGKHGIDLLEDILLIILVKLTKEAPRCRRMRAGFDLPEQFLIPFRKRVMTKVITPTYLSAEV